MSAERCRVGLLFNDEPLFYQREQEYRKDGRWAARPYFEARSHSITMSEGEARVLIQRLRSLGRHDAWIEDARDGRKIDVPFESQSSGEDTRQPMIASLDDSNWYIVKPANTPAGPKWFLTMFVPGLPERATIYADDPLGVLRRATDMNYLQFAEVYQRPPEPPQQATPKFNGPRRRPGDLR